MKRALFRRGCSLLLLAALLAGCGNGAVSIMDKNGNIVEVASSGADTYTFRLPGEKAEPAEGWDNPFIDVTEGAWYYDAVRYCYINNLMRGTTKNTFSPYLSTSRGMIAATLWRMEGSPAVSGSSPFTDVSPSQYYADAIAWAAQKGVVDGYSAELFGPEDPVTREQMAAILYRYASYRGYDTSSQASLLQFVDSQDASGYAVEALSWAVANNVVNGMEDHTLVPRGDATRAQVAALLMYFRENIAKEM